MSCDVGELTESLENEQSSFSKLSVTSPMSQLILKPFRCFTYVTTHNPSFVSPTSQALHLCHLASHPWLSVSLQGVLWLKCYPQSKFQFS